MDYCLLAREIPQGDAFRLKDLRAGVPWRERAVCKVLQLFGEVGNYGEQTKAPSRFGWDLGFAELSPAFGGEALGLHVV